MAANSYRSGQTVEWSWGSGTARGKVNERFARKVQRTLKGSKIVRNGNADDPAYLIEQENGDQVLKLGSELKGG